MSIGLLLRIGGLGGLILTGLLLLDQIAEFRFLCDESRLQIGGSIFGLSLTGICCLRKLAGVLLLRLQRLLFFGEIAEQCFVVVCAGRASIHSDSGQVRALQAVGDRHSIDEQGP